MILEILLPLPFDQTFDYMTESSDIVLGDFVEVSFQGRILTGVVWGIKDSSPHKKLKSIDHKIEGFFLPPKMIQFIQKVASYTLAPKGLVLKLCFNPKYLKIKKSKEKKALIIAEKLVSLSDDQDKAATLLRNAVDQAKYAPFVLDGVTGSGKTEVYFEAIAEAIHQGKQTLVLLPEIALSRQWLMRFHERFGFDPVVWHSDTLVSNRPKDWQDVLKGDAQVVVGARSALFLPFSKLGLIIVDEEHDGSYKQESGVFYNARDMAILRAHLENVPVILSTATPSLETWHNVMEGRYQHLELPQRYGKASLPDISIIDMRPLKMSKGKWISKPLEDAIRTTIQDKGQQVLLYLNRRGYAPLIVCNGCGHHMICHDCSSWLVYHKYQNHLLCHHCGHTLKYPKTCPQCQELDTLIPYGPGVERLAEEVTEIFPEANILIMTSDTLDSAKSRDQAFSDIESGKTQIIIGTQAIAKGHHFPKLTLVGVVDADLGMNGGDLRAAERTYQLLHQVAGRAGRVEDKGYVLLQSYTPENPLLQTIVSQDRAAFIDLELSNRRPMMMPPFGRLAALIISCKSEEKGRDLLKILSSKTPRFSDVTVLGPAPAPLYKLGGWYRFRYLVHFPKNIHIQTILRNWVEGVSLPKDIKIQIDIDPYSFL